MITAVHAFINIVKCNHKFIVFVQVLHSRSIHKTIQQMRRSHLHLEVRSQHQLQHNQHFLLMLQLLLLVRMHSNLMHSNRLRQISSASVRVAEQIRRKQDDQCEQRPGESNKHCCTYEIFNNTNRSILPSFRRNLKLQNKTIFILSNIQL